MPDQRESAEAKSIDDGLEITKIGIGVIVAEGIPVTLASAALIESDDAVFVRERRCYRAPCTGESTQTVQEQDRIGVGPSPLAAQEAQAIGLHELGALIRQRPIRLRRVVIHPCFPQSAQSILAHRIGGLETSKARIQSTTGRHSKSDQYLIGSG